MESILVLKELNHMPALIKSDTLAWKKYMDKGTKCTSLYAATYAKVFDAKNAFDRSKVREQLLYYKQLLQQLGMYLDTIYQKLKCILNALADIQRRTQRRLSRVRLFCEDELLRKHRITWDLSTSMLLDFLEFLQVRYDCEWEVKEMVVTELNKIMSNNDGSFLADLWENNIHAGGIEFEIRLNHFYGMAGLVPALADECKCTCTCNSAAKQSKPLNLDEDTSET